MDSHYTTELPLVDIKRMKMELKKKESMEGRL